MRNTLVFICTALLAFHSFSSTKLEIPFEKYKLDNGLEVILAPSDKSPFVAVDIWYHVGADQEELGKTGFAHLFEHLMFQGTPHVGDDKHFAYLQAAGATMVNGTTNNDRTNYFEVLPSHELDLALWLESDRMGFLMDGMTLEKLNNQRDVVKNERRQTTENRPYGLVNEKAWQTIFPKSHPYYGDVIGSMDDLDAASMKDVSDFFKKYYAASNATLVIAGHFDASTVKSKVQKYFGTFAKKAKPERKQIAVPKLDREVILKEIEPLGQLPLVQLQFLTPAFYAPGDAELDVLSYALTGSKNGLLTKPLEFDEVLVQGVSARQASMGNVSVYTISAMVPDPKNINKVRKIIDEVLSSIAAQGVDESLIKESVAMLETQVLFGLQSHLSRAENLQNYNHFLKDPNGLQADLARYRNTTQAGIQKVVKSSLRKDARVVTIAMPKSMKSFLNSIEG